jgi:probable addiction module antidote protein
MVDITTPVRTFDVAAHTRTIEEAAADLSVVLEEDDPAAFRRALGDVASSRSMASIADARGFGRESLSKALSQAGNPSLDTVVMAALGLALAVVPAQQTSIAESG